MSTEKKTRGRPKLITGEPDHVTIRFGSSDEIAELISRLTIAAQMENPTATRTDVARDCLLDGARLRASRVTP